jgi:hypothetical protein
MDAEEKSRLIGLLYQMKLMVNAEALDADLFFKALMSAAHEAYKSGEDAWAMDLLGKVPIAYYKVDLLAHMNNDQVFAVQAYELATWLARDNYVHVGFNEDEKGQVIEV